MRNYVVSDKFIVRMNSATGGIQNKYLRNEYWYKINNSGREGFVEHLISILLRNSTLSTDDYVYYEQCKINSKQGCRSKSFLLSDEIFVSLSKIYKTIYGIDLQAMLSSKREVKDRVDCLVLFLKNDLGIQDARSYLKTIFLLDMLICNRDRHLSNLGVIFNYKTGRFRPAPIFDNGLSLNTGLSYSTVCHAVTVSGSFEQSVIACGYPIKSTFKINYDSFVKTLKEKGILYSEKESVALQILLDNMEKYKGIFRL